MRPVSLEIAGKADVAGKRPAWVAVEVPGSEYSLSNRPSDTKYRSGH
jgi:hypothetical protein